MIFYNKKIFKAAGIDTTNPPLHTYAEFLATAKKIVAAKAAKYAIYPAPSSEFYQPWYDFYPAFAAATGGKQLVVDGKSQFTSPEGMAVINFWKQIYADNLAGKETVTGDTFADGTAAMATVGPWAIASYKGKVDWGVVPVPTANGMAASAIHTFSDAKNVGLYTSCKNKGTAWDFLKFSTSQAQDGQLLTMTGQMPLRKDLPTDVFGLLRQEPGLQVVRRPGRPDHRGAVRGQLGADLADLPGCVDERGDLREGRRHADFQRRRNQDRLPREVLSSPRCLRPSHHAPHPRSVPRTSPARPSSLALDRPPAVRKHGDSSRCACG